MENAFEQDIQSEEELLTDTETEPEIVSEKEVPVSYTEIIEKGTYHKRTVRNTSYEPYLSFRLYQDYV